VSLLAFRSGKVPARHRRTILTSDKIGQENSISRDLQGRSPAALKSFRTNGTNGTDQGRTVWSRIYPRRKRCDLALTSDRMEWPEDCARVRIRQAVWHAMHGGWIVFSFDTGGRRRTLRSKEISKKKKEKNKEKGTERRAVEKRFLDLTQRKAESVIRDKKAFDSYQDSGRGQHQLGGF
jgi:hypothetical protein